LKPAGAPWEEAPFDKFAEGLPDGPGQMSGRFECVRLLSLQFCHHHPVADAFRKGGVSLLFVPEKVECPSYSSLLFVSLRPGTDHKQVDDNNLDLIETMEDLLP
jgi:hypothetical protein